MKNVGVCFSASLVAVTAAVVAAVAALDVMHIHEHTSHSTVAFVDAAAVMQQSDAGKSIHDQIAPRQKTLQEAAQAKLKELKEEQEELSKQRHSLPADRFAELDAALAKKIGEWNVEAEKREKALNDAANPAVQKVQAVLREQLVVIASENKFTSILPLQEVFYADKELDVTSEAIRRVNKQLPKVDVSFSEEKPAK